MENYFYRRVFKTVTPLPNYHLKIDMETGNEIFFDFTSRLKSIRFCILQDEHMFNSVYTDGDAIIFKTDEKKLIVSADDLMDLLMIDRTI